MRPLARCLPVVVSLLLPGCAALVSEPARSPVPSEAAGLVARADELASADPRAARSAYQQVLRDFPNTPEVPRALYGLARLEVNPRSPIYDYGSARVLFDRLLRTDPAGPYASAARAWRAVLGRLEKCETYSAKLADDLDRLKKLDMDIERQP